MIVVALLFALRVIAKSMEGFVDASSDTTFTLYYAEWCPHCKTIKPAFADWSKNGFVTVAGKNVKLQMVEAEKEPSKARGKPIKGYPTILLETASGQFHEYTGDRTPEGYMKFLNEQLSAGA